MSIKNIDEIEWEKTEYGKRKTLVNLDLGVPITVRYVVIEGEVTPHSHPKGEVIIVLKGEGIIIFENWEKEVRAGEILIIPPNVKQGIKKTSKENIEAIAILP
ncbi:MAG: cupin domain-containing protein [Candidatus Methanomethylicia archaeon]